MHKCVQLVKFYILCKSDSQKTWNWPDALIWRITERTLQGIFYQGQIFKKKLSGDACTFTLIYVNTNLIFQFSRELKLN